MSKRQRPEYVVQRIARRSAELSRLGHLACEVRAILMADWDPCCISDVQQCADEYDSYIPTVCGLILDGRTADDLTNYLHFIQSDWMGLRHRGIGNCRQVADKLHELLPRYALQVTPDHLPGCHYECTPDEWTCVAGCMNMEKT